MYDVAIIGGGVIGCAIAWELSKYQVKTIILEKNLEVCEGTSKANSAIVHGGFDAAEGSLKARMNVRGNAMFPELAAKLDFHFENNGSLVVAFSEEEMEELYKLKKRGEVNGVTSLEIWDKARTHQEEPNLSEEVVGALYCGSAGIVCPFNLTYAFLENAMENGVQLKTSAQVTGVHKEQEGFVLNIQGEEPVKARFVVNAAGIYAEQVAAMVGDYDYHITPRKGEYRLLDRSEGGIVKRVIFQAPTKDGKGILVSPTVHGNIIVGPTAEVAEGPEDTSTTPEGLAKLDAAALKSVPSLRFNKTIRVFTGLRATPDTHDFMLYQSKSTPGFIHAGGIESPGLVSSPAIAEYMTELLREAGLQLQAKTDFKETRKRIPAFAHMTEKEREEAIRQNPKYGKLICRCESVSEAEIVAAIHRPGGAVTVDGVKRRVRPGSGRCQGGFCGPRVVEILSRELHIPYEDVLKDSKGSKIVASRMKGGH